MVKDRALSVNMSFHSSDANAASLLGSVTFPLEEMVIGLQSRGACTFVANRCDMNLLYVAANLLTS